ncbi:hypothetical protein ElyMa_005134000 [Elysia marginata]|uniref:Uncharacterized protein n=1 Tax=Elysia marginata TaxID=1093978 RepID=A0AAV4JRA9_9GAST|nr:hypothetical protein ElyMa_005134000 [Elysia marginata]
MTRYFKTKGSKQRGRPKTSIVTTLRRDLKCPNNDHRPTRLHSINDLDHLRDIAQNRSDWKHLTTAIYRSAQAETYAMYAVFQNAVKSIIQLLILALFTGKICSETCPSYSLGLHDRVAEGKELRETVHLPDDLVNLTWQSSNISCLGQTRYKFSTCEISRAGLSCTQEITGYDAKLLQANDTRSAEAVWSGLPNTNRSAGVNSTTSAARSGAHTTGSHSFSNVGYKLYLRISRARRSFESLGSSLTYVTTSGKTASLRAFRPLLVFSELPYLAE